MVQSQKLEKDGSASMNHEEQNRDIIHRVGEAAGKVWQFLNDNSPATLSQMSKQLKLEEGVFWMAVGWLAREGKICFEGHGKESKVSLN